MVQVAAHIRRVIAERGPITFAEFMELALYGPGGFYEEPPVGEQGHFVTSPHVHPIFGELVARGLEGIWESLGRPDPFRVVEVGAGDGTLARHVLAFLRDAPLEYVAIDRSAGARARLDALPLKVAASLESLSPGMVGCVIANELLDNLPFHRLRGTKKGVVQICVGLEGDRFVPVAVPCEDEELLEATPELAPGQEAAVSLEALQFVDRLARVLRHGYAILIDYGASPGSWIHGYRAHRVVADVLADPGSADITAGVDFPVIEKRAGDWGLQTLGPIPQSVVLTALGFEAWTERERLRQAELLQSGSGLEAVRAFGGRSRASLLVDRASLGQLQWLLLATAERPWPAWALQAAGRAE